MIAFLSEYGPKVAYSVILIFLSGVFFVELLRVWTDTRLSIVPFAYERDGEVQTEAGANFARRVSQSLRRAYFVYSGGNAPEGPIASTDQFDRSLDVDLPGVQSSNLESIEVQAYGINFGSLLKGIRGWLRENNEIVGFVSHYGSKIEVQANIQGQIARHADPSLATGLNLGWDISDSSGDPGEASFQLACGVFRMLAISESDSFRSIRDADFCQFLKALETYQEYRIALSRNLPKEETEKLLVETQRLVQPLEGTRFPFAVKLAGLSYREQEQYAKAKRVLNRYLELLAEQKQTDTKVAALIAEIDKNLAESKTVEVAEVGGEAEVRQLSMGVSISSADGTAGTLCCFVKNAAGKRFALTSDHVVGPVGSAVIQPGVTDGGRPEDRIGSVAKVLTGPATGGELAGALIELDPGQEEIDFAIPEMQGQKPTGIATAKVGDDIFSVGRTSGVVEGKVTAVELDNVTLATGPSQSETFNGMIETSSISRGGDSGAPVFNANNELLGIVYAGGTNNTLLIPIERILKAFEVELIVDADSG